MTRRRQRLALGGVTIAVVVVTVGLLSAPGRSPVSGRGPLSVGGDPAVKAADESGDLRSYALAATELQGLPPDVAPGTTFELWVAWDPPLTRKPVVERLLRRVTLATRVPAVTPNGPDAVILEVKRGQVAALLYGDRYGALSLVGPGSAPPRDPAAETATP